MSSFLNFQLSSDYTCLIWSTTREQAKHLLGLSEESFIDAVNRALVMLHKLWQNCKKTYLFLSMLIKWVNYSNSIEKTLLIISRILFIFRY